MYIIYFKIDEIRKVVGLKLTENTHLKVLKSQG